MRDPSNAPGELPTDLSSRRQIALDRIHQLIADAQLRGTRAGRNYFVLQLLAIGLAALTPCFIILAKESPGSWLLNWLQLFLPAIAAISAGIGHLVRWRDEAVRDRTLAESVRSQLWRFQTRAAEFSGLSDEQALDRLVLQVDELNLKSVARWSAEQLTESPPLGTAVAAHAEARTRAG
jgi:hypothetical protein